MKRLIILAACFAAVASAADISGNWKGTAENQGQSIQRTFTFKVDGAKLTGETNSEMLGKSTIDDGKVDGDTISFSITANLGGNEMKITYKGKISGDTIKLTSQFPGMDGGQGQNIEWTLKKAS
ncbi:MAG: hypothetical protein ABSB88_16775 [Bryobacteraceae bacterium]|jgi:hypothetical protein